MGLTVMNSEPETFHLRGGLALKKYDKSLPIDQFGLIVAEW
jgi:hypothetical protein